MFLDQLKKQSLDAISYFDIKEAAVVVKDLEYQLRKKSEMPDQNQQEIKVKI